VISHGRRSAPAASQRLTAPATASMAKSRIVFQVDGLAPSAPGDLD
jgi:hypothetical protein